MTGQGHATGQLGETSIDVDVRSVNNRFLKISSRISDGLQNVESAAESLVRQYVRRGTVQVQIRLTGDARSDAYRLNSTALEAYAHQAKAIAERLNLSSNLDIGQLLQLPGVVDEHGIVDGDSGLVDLAKQVIEEALVKMNAMRSHEGETMARELTKSVVELRVRSERISERAPLVVDEYKSRLQSKLEAALRELGTTLEPSDILREVQIFADRCDIREELIRLESHLVQFEMACREKESQGRKLDFLVQELNREINTIGSKANDATIAEAVVNMKTTLEQIRELIQNIE